MAGLGGRSRFTLPGLATLALALSAGCCGPCRPRLARCGCPPPVPPCHAAERASPTTAGPASLDAVLEITSQPRADVWVDGRSVGAAPVSPHVGAGTHHVVLRLGGFVQHEQSVEVAPGAVAKVAVTLVAHDLNDRQVLQLLAGPGQVFVQPFTEPSRERGGGAGAGPVRVLFPRGLLRPADLGSYRVESDVAGGTQGAVEFRRGGVLLHRESVKIPPNGEVLGKVPASLQAKVKTGDKISWGFFPASGEPVTAEFEVVQRDLDAALEGVTKSAKGQPEAAQSHLRAQVYLDAGLSYAAYQEAQKVVEKGAPSVRAWAMMLEALDGMGAMRESRAWREAQSQLGAFSSRDRAEVYPPQGHAFQKLLGQVRSGQVGRALTSLDAVAQAETAREPAQVLALAGALAAGAQGAAKASPGSAKVLADALLETARLAVEKAPESATSHRALAEARLARARLELYKDETPPAGRWVEAAETVLRAAAIDPERGAAARRAIEILLEAAEVPGADAAAVLAEAEAVAADTAQRFPDEPASRVGLAVVKRARAQALPKKARAEAAALVKRALEDLQPLLQESSPDPEAATEHAALVTLVRRRDLPVKVAYVAAEHVSDESLVRLQVPLSLRWRVADDLRGRELLVLRQLGAEGQLDRLITLRDFRWGVPYHFVGAPSRGWSRGGEVNGDDATGLAAGDYEDALRAFAKVASTTKPRPGGLSRRFDRGYVYAVEGQDAEGGFLRVRSWLVRSEAFQLHYLVTVRDLRADVPAEDPELTFVLESLADVEKR